jgi:TrmH family RNA methyltransferase
MFLVEGPQAVREALIHRPHHVVDLFLTPASAERHSDLVELAQHAGIEIALASEDVLASMCDTVTPQGVLAVCDFVDVTLAEVVATNPTNVAVLHHVKDPGNVGNIIRSADAAGAGAVIVTAQSVDVYNPKVVRATTGSLFHIPVVTGVDLAESLAHLHHAGLTVYATEARGTGLDLLASSGALATPLAWVFGNEAHGLSEEELELAHQRVAVPLYGQAESLSLQTAAALCLYQTAFAQTRNTHP